MQEKRSTSPAIAICWGVLSVNGPVAVLLASASLIPLIVGAFLGPYIPLPLNVVLMVVIGAAVWCSAWLYWSISLPRWRLWAYSRVEDIDKLHTMAVSYGLLWRDGHFFERTEIYPGHLRQRVNAARRR